MFCTDQVHTKTSPVCETQTDSLRKSAKKPSLKNVKGGNSYLIKTVYMYQNIRYGSKLVRQKNKQINISSSSTG